MGEKSLFQKSESNLHYTRGVTPNRVTSVEVHLRKLAPGQHSSEETSQRWRSVGDTGFDLTSMKVEPQAFCADGDVLTTELTGRLFPKLTKEYFVKHFGLSFFLYSCRHPRKNVSPLVRKHRYTSVKNDSLWKF